MSLPCVELVSALDALDNWSFEPWVLACLALSAGVYVLGLARLWRRAGVGRGAGATQAIAFAAGWFTLVVALVSPLDAFGARFFSVHMVQHELLMIVAAPLFVLARPLGIWSWGLPRPLRHAVGWLLHRTAWRTGWRCITAPLAAWTLHAAALWVWHVPRFFEAALASEAVHALQHIAFLVTALLFWWSVLGATTRRAQGIGLLSLFATMVHSGALGALLALSNVTWYASYANTAGLFGLTALEDQQLGGLVMWVPTGLIYVAAGLAIAARWLAAPTPSARVSRRPVVRREGTVAPGELRSLPRSP